MKSYDVIVIGLGGVGTAAAWRMAARGLRTLGLEQYAVAHGQGSSHGQTRAIRMAYFEHPDYVPLLRHSYRLWAELETLANQQLFYRVGLLEVGPADGVLVPGILKAAREHELPVDEVSWSEVTRRFPQFRMPGGAKAVWEADAGYLLVEDCVRAQAAAATQLGAELLWETTVLGWGREGAGYVVRTERDRFLADRIVIAGGPWSHRLLHDVGLPLTVLRKNIYWYPRYDGPYHRRNHCPVFFFEVPEGFFYGFPDIDGRGVKVGEHSGGTVIPEFPSGADHLHDEEDFSRVNCFLTGHLPGVTLTGASSATCWYTMTPDQHFIIDRHPIHSGCAFAAGLSGHGFKFVPILGEMLTELIAGESAEHPAAFLKCRPFR